MPQLKGAIAHCEKVHDYVSRDLFSEILENEEKHVDTLEQQFEMIARMGLQNYIQLQSEAGRGARVCRRGTGTHRRTLRRYLTLDVVRGVAVMGILLGQHLRPSRFPSAAYFSPLAWGGHGTGETAAWLTNFVFVEGKMRGLFSFLFGASMLLVIERAKAAGEVRRRVHFSRMVVLFLFGVAHGYLIWCGDILAHLRARSERSPSCSRGCAPSQLLAAALTALLLTLIWNGMGLGAYDGQRGAQHAGRGGEPGTISPKGFGDASEPVARNGDRRDAGPMDLAGRFPLGSPWTARWCAAQDLRDRDARRGAVRNGGPIDRAS